MVEWEELKLIKQKIKKEKDKTNSTGAEGNEDCVMLQTQITYISKHTVGSETWNLIRKSICFQAKSR